MKRIYKSSTNKQIMGVCGGVADYLGIDATIIRIIVLFIFFAGGVGIPFYFILGFILPYDYEVNSEQQRKRNVHSDSGYFYRNFHEEATKSTVRKDVTPKKDDVWSDF